MWYQQDADKIIISVYIQPGAKRTEVTGLHGDALKIRLQAPPIDGRANDALSAFLASCFQIPVRQVSLKRGEKSRHKVLVITGSSIHPDVLKKST